MKFLCVVGTRPEAIKLAPVIHELSRHAQAITLCSGQHTDLVKDALDWFGIAADDQIALARETDSLAELTASLMIPMERAMAAHRPDVVIAQGDTTTVMVTAMTAFFLGIKFAHVEAGLRTGDLRAPFPEEFNRLVASRLAAWHFCPTKRAVANLRTEGVDPAQIFLTGNTVIDALRFTLDRLKLPPADVRRRILLTAHRRENQGPQIDAICRAVRAIVDEFADAEFVIPVHPSPAVRRSFEEKLSGHDRVLLLQPLSYPHLVTEMARAYLILTDSGGMQEEAPYLKKPVLVLRRVTERPEAVELGVARVIGTGFEDIVAAVRGLMTDKALYKRMAEGGSPYGDGLAAKRIAAAFGFGDEIIRADH